jgi:hypothetical protein
LHNAATLHRAALKMKCIAEPGLDILGFGIDFCRSFQQSNTLAEVRRCDPFDPQLRQLRGIGPKPPLRVAGLLQRACEQKESDECTHISDLLGSEVQLQGKLHDPAALR